MPRSLVRVPLLAALAGVFGCSVITFKIDGSGVSMITGVGGSGGSGAGGASGGSGAGGPTGGTGG